MEAVQPRQRKRTAAMRPFSSMAESCRTSPQTGLVTSILAVGLGSSPEFRGDWKWSRRVAENMGRVSQRGRRGVEGEAKKRGTVTRRSQREERRVHREEGRKDEKREDGLRRWIVRAHPSRRRRAKDETPSSTSLSGVTR